MTLAEFKEALHLPTPPITNALLSALWYDAKGDWNKAHDLVNDLEGKEAAWVHAYLHRKEGDQSNASYWYARAKKDKPAYSQQQEWEEIVSALLKLSRHEIGLHELTCQQDEKIR